MRGDLRWWRRLGGAGALVALAFTLAACGGGSPAATVASLGGSSSNGGTTTTGDPGGAVGNSPGGGAPGGGAQMEMNVGSDGIELSHCMQTHGEPNFPDPGSNGSISISSADGVDPNSPAFQKAMNDCRKYEPNGGKLPTGAALQKIEKQLLEYSACMRANGVPTFPDPTFSGGAVGIRINSGAGAKSSSGIDPNSPEFQHAQTVCQKIMSGALGGAPKLAPTSGAGPTGQVAG